MTQVTVLNCRRLLVEAGRGWDDVLAWARIQRHHARPRWGPSELRGQPAGILIAYLEAGAPVVPRDVPPSIPGRREVPGDRPDSQARAVEAARMNRPPTASDLLDGHGLSWSETVRPWALSHGWTTKTTKPNRPTRSAVAAYLAHMDASVELAS